MTSSTPTEAHEPLELKFKQAEGLDIYMDVYLAPSSSAGSPAPILLWWHGGGLLQGTRKAVSPHHLAAPATHNITFVSADYRLAPQFRLPAILEDCADAIKFLHTSKFKSATHGRADSSRVIVSGSSAGGWLSLLCGTGIGLDDSSVPRPRPVQGIAAIYPITDLEDKFWKTKQRPKVTYMDRLIADEEVQPFVNPEDKESRVAFSSLDSRRAMFYHYMVQEALLEGLLLDGTSIPPEAFSVARGLKHGTEKYNVPPTYIVHGDVDDRVPAQQARDVVEALEALKGGGTAVEYLYEELPEVNHGFDKAPEYEMDKMYSFIGRVFK